MFPILSSFFAPKPTQNQKPSTKPENPAKDNGPLLLELVYNNSPALMDSLELSSKAKKEDLPSPLLYASPTRDSKQHLKTIDTECVNEDGDTVLTRTANYGDYPDATRKLIKAGANLNRKDEKGRDPLTLNTVNYHPKALKEILDFRTKQEINDPVWDLRTLFEEEPVEIKVPLNQDKKGNTALHHAVQQKNYDALYRLTEAPIETDDINKEGDTALHLAAKEGDSYALLRLMKRRPDVTIQDKEGKIPLMQWVANVKPDSNLQILGRMYGGRAITGQWKLPAFYQASQQLLSQSATNVNIQDKQGKTTLSHLADSPNGKTRWGLIGSTSLALLEANVDIQDQEGLTPLMRFAKTRPQSSEICHELVFRQSKDINKKDNQGKSAVIHAAENGNLPALASIVLHHKDNLFTFSEPAEGPLLDINCKDDEGQTVLMKLANLDADKLNISVWKKGIRQYVNFRNRHNPVVNELNQVLPSFNPLVRTTALQLHAGADPTLKDKAGNTALMIAAKKGNLPVLEVLSQKLETLKQKNRDGKTALQVARDNHQKAAVKLLEQAEAKIKEPLT